MRRNICSMVVGGLTALGTSARVAVAAGEAAASRLPDTMPTDRDAIMELLSRLTDADVRELLRRQLEHGIAGHQSEVGPASASLVGSFDHAIGLVRDRLGEMLSAWPQLPSIVTGVQDWLSAGRSVWQPLVAIAFATVMLAVAFLVERLALRLAGRRTPDLPAPPLFQVSSSLAGVLAEALFGMFRVAMFCVAALGFFTALYHGHEPTRQLVLGILGIVVVARLTALVSRIFILSSGSGAPWLLVSPAIGPLLHRRLIGLGLIAGVAYVSAGILRAAKIEAVLIYLFALLLAITLCGWIVATILAVRGRTRTSGEFGVSLGGNELAAALRSKWHIIASGYVVVVFAAGFVAVLLGRTGVLFDVLGAIFVPVGIAIADIELTRWFERAAGARSPDGPSAANLVLHRFLRVVIYVFGAMLVLRLIGFDLMTIASESLGGPASTALFSICMTVLLAFVVWEIARMAIDREIAKEKVALGPVDEDNAEGGASTASRLRTMLPLLRRAILATIAVITTMIVLTSLGVNIGPLLAGAGVVGLALGFGAQTVVRDMLSGVFFLAEDAFRLGEYVEVGNIRGTVEGIAIRSLRLRHHRGAVHTLPFGQIPRITNYSRDWVIQKLPFHLPFDTDLTKVKRIVKRIGAELVEDSDLGKYFLQPLKMQGVREMTHDSMIVGVKFMAKADDGQFTLRREIYKRIRDEFAKNGIEFARPQVMVVAPSEDTPIEAAAAATVALAARANVP